MLNAGVINGVNHFVNSKTEYEYFLKETFIYTNIQNKSI